MKLVREVLKRLDNENLALKLANCEFFQSEVNWLGHKLSPTGIVPKITKRRQYLTYTHLNHSNNCDLSWAV